MPRTEQAVEGIGSILFGGIGELGIEGGGCGAAVAKQGLNMAQTQTLFKQMSG